MQKAELHDLPILPGEEHCVNTCHAHIIAQLEEAGQHLKS